MTEENEKKNQRIALFTTIGVNGILLFLLLFVMAWKAPDPPLPEYGIELNFGMDSQGSGDIQPEVPVGDESTENDEQQSTPEEVVRQESVPETAVEQETPAETAVEEVPNKMESPVVVKEEKVNKPVEKPIEKKPEPKKEEPKPVERKPDPSLGYKPPSKGKAGEAGSQGDDANKVGDKGSSEGKINDSEIYKGTPGGGSGGVSMSGFNGFDFPKVDTPSLPNDAYGEYTFTVKVDEEGVVLSVIADKRGLSLEAERRLRETIQKLVFVPKGSNPQPSSGKITFRVVSK